MEQANRRRVRFSLAILLVTAAGCFPLVESGCSGTDTTTPTADAAADSANDATRDSSVGVDGGATDAGIDAFDADVDPPFDCTQDAAAGVTPPNDLRCTGLYDRWTLKTIATTAFEYKPAYTLW